MEYKLDCFEVIVGDCTIYIPCFLKQVFKERTGQQLDIEKYVSVINRTDLSDTKLNEYVLHAILHEMYA